MQKPDNFHFHCFEKNAVKVFSRDSVNEVLTKYSKSITGFLAANALKYAIHSIFIFIAIYRFLWFLHEKKIAILRRTISKCQKYLEFISLLHPKSRLLAKQTSRIIQISGTGRH